MSETVIRQLTDKITIFSAPFYRFGLIPFGGRSTAIKLASNSLWILASTKPDGSVQQKITELGGQVEYLVAPDTEHMSFLQSWAELYPKAKIIAMEGADKKMPNLNFTGLYTKDQPSPRFGFENEIQAQYFSGHTNKDVAFLHIADGGSLIQADLLFNLPGYEQFSKTKKGVPSTWMMGSTINPQSKSHQVLLKLTTQDKDEVIKSAKAVADWKFERIIPCHGEVIESGGNSIWRDLYKAFINPHE